MSREGRLLRRRCRGAGGGVNAVKESDRAVSKQIRVLENRLDKALVKFNEALAFNKQVRLSHTIY